MANNDLQPDEYLKALESVRDNGLWNTPDLPFRDKLYKGMTAKIRKTLEEFADGRSERGRILSLSDIAKLNGVTISIWSLTVLYKEVHDAIAVAERTRAEKLNEAALDQLFDDDILNEYARNDLDEITSPGVALLRARSEALHKQAEIANKGKFGKAPDIAITVQGTAVDNIESLEDLSKVDMIELRPAGARERIK